MAERSKAPDSRIISFPVLTGSSGLQMEAWVRIPLLTRAFFFSFSFFPFYDLQVTFRVFLFVTTRMNTSFT